MAQAVRLWSIDEDIARRVLDSYVESGYLTVTTEGRYLRTDVVTRRFVEEPTDDRHPVRASPRRVP